MDAELRGLFDKQEITELMYLRARSADRLDEALALSCYHEGATEKHGTYDGPADAFVRRFSGQFSGPNGFVSMTHHISNLVIELAGNDASAESYYLCDVRVRKDGAERDVIIGGRYLDRLERRGGRWAIVHRDCIYDWSRMEPAEARYWDWQYGGDQPELLRGSNDQDDPLYTRLKVQRGRRRQITPVERSPRSKP
jgi:hypothetical protein